MSVAGVMESLADFDAACEPIAAAASMSETIRYSPCAELGTAAVTCLPRMTEARSPVA